MPFIWVIRGAVYLFRTLGPVIARNSFRLAASSYLSSLVLAATKPFVEQEIYLDTLQFARSYPSYFRQVFFELLKESAEDIAWRALVEYGRKVLENDPTLQETIEDLLGVDLEGAG